jgi:hypothetical protein
MLRVDCRGEVERSLPMASLLDGFQKMWLHYLVSHPHAPCVLPFCLGDRDLPAAERWVSWTREYKLWVHVNDHTDKCVWPRLCPYPLCDDLITDDQTLWQHLVDTHGLSHSRPDPSSRKRKHSDGIEFLNWTPDNGLCSSTRSRLKTLTISPQLLSKPTSAAYHVDELECLKELDLDGTSLDGCITETEESHLENTDTCSTDDSFFSEFLRSRSPTCTPVGDFSGCSSDTAVDPDADEILPTASAEPLSGAPDRNLVPADGQSHAATKPTRIRLRLNPPSQRPRGTKIILRLKGPKLGKATRKGRKKA